MSKDHQPPIIRFGNNEGISVRNALAGAGATLISGILIGQKITSPPVMPNCIPVSIYTFDPRYNAGPNNCDVTADISGQPLDQLLRYGDVNGDGQTVICRRMLAGPDLNMPTPAPTSSSSGHAF